MPVLAGSAPAVVVLIAGLTFLRLFSAATVGLSLDEAYYWVWAQNLAFGYLDHPPMVALWIRLSTLLGDSPFGVRWLSVIGAAFLSLAVAWLTQAATGRRDDAIAAAALTQATLFMGVGAMIVTPDTPLVMFWTLSLMALTRVGQGGHGAWWLAAGLMIGLAFQSKYTAVFLAAGVLLWLVAVPALRHNFRSLWTYAGGLVCLVIIAPVVHWNLANDGASFAKQFGRAVPRAFDPRFVPEFIAGQAALLTPAIGVLVLFGLIAGTRRVLGNRAPVVGLMIATSVPLIAYLLWYGLFDRVQGNWTACLLPASIVLAVSAVRSGLPDGVVGRVLAWCWRWSVVSGIAISLIVMSHAQFRLFALAVDPVSQTAGWDGVAREARAMAAREGAATIGTVYYTATGQLRFHTAGAIPVVQLNDPIRFAMEPPPDLQRLAHRPILVVVEQRHANAAGAILRRAYRDVVSGDTITRLWRGVAVEQLAVFVVSAPRSAGRPDIGPLSADVVTN